MIDRLTKSPALLALMFLLAAAIGGGIVAAAERLGAGSGDGAEVRDYLLAHPEVIPEAMDRLRERQTAKVIADNRAGILDPFASAWAGNPKGDVTLVAYMDYACGYCRASLPVIAQAISADPKLRVVYREYPVLSRESETAARWALAAAEQGKFRAFHDAVYAAGALTESTIASAADRAGLDKAQAATAAGSGRVEQELVKNHKVAAELGMTGTPSWVVGNQVIAGAASLETLQQAIAKARAAR